MRQRAKDTKRRPGWIGYQVAVCGYQLNTQQADLICLLPPKHPDTTPHASIASDEDIPVMIVQREDHTEWISPQ